MVYSACRFSPWDQRKDWNWTGLDQLGLDQWSIYGLVFSVRLPGAQFQGLIKTRFKSVATGFLWKPLLDHVSTLTFIDFHPWIIKNGQELVKIWQKSFLHKYFVMIRMTLITLLITCAIFFFGTPGYYPRHINNTLNHVYDVYFISSTPLTSYNNLQTTDMIGWVLAMSFHSGHKIVKS